MRVTVIIIEIIGGLTLFPWFAMAGISFMAFDSPKSTRKIMPWLFIISIFSYPFVIGGSYWWAWANLSIGRTKEAIFWSVFPIIIFGTAYVILTRSSNFLKKFNK
jgi:hypothetical protein